jgi:hypothetical protein
MEERSRILAAYQRCEPEFIPLREMGGYLEPEELQELLANGLQLYRLERDDQVVKAVEVHEFVEACVEHAYALELLEAIEASDRTPAAS